MRFLLLFFLMLMISFISCNKDDDEQEAINEYPKECTCTTTTSFQGMTTSESVTIMIDEGECSDGNSSTSFYGTTVTVSCN